MNTLENTHISLIALHFGLTAEGLAPLGGDFPNYYVSKTGRIFSMMRGAAHELLPWQRSPATYKRVTAYDASKAKRTLLVHRLVALAFLPAPADGENVVRHLNGAPSDNNAANLAWGTYADNAADREAHGRTARGERHGKAKLTRAEVKKLRALMGQPDASWTYAALGRELGVGPDTVARAMKGETWCHLPLGQKCSEGGE